MPAINPTSQADSREIPIFQGKDAGTFPLRIEGSGGLRLDKLRARTGLSAKAVMKCFDSLGDTCEFGMVQRVAGAEPLSLLRFAKTPLPNLLKALETGFVGFGEKQNLKIGVRPDGLAYQMRECAFALDLGFFPYPQGVDLASLHEQESVRLKFLARKLMKRITTGETIFVIRTSPDRPALTEQLVLPVFQSLRAFGPCQLLWITLASAENPPGTVEQTVEGLLHGYVDRLAPDRDQCAFSFPVWLEVCVNALSLSGRIEKLRPDMPIVEVRRRGQTQAPRKPENDMLPPPGLDLIEQIRFGRQGNDSLHLGAGWSGPEPGMRWTQSDSCELRLKHPGNRDILLEIDAWPFVAPPRLSAQNVSILANGMPVGSVAFNAGGQEKASLDIDAASVPSGDELLLTFLLHDAARPTDLALSTDGRLLALAFRQLSLLAPIRPARQQGLGEAPTPIIVAGQGSPDYPLLQLVTFGESGNDQEHLVQGWYGPEQDYRWTSGNACDLHVAHPGENDIAVVIEAWPFVHPPHLPKQRAILSVSGVQVAELAFTEPARKAVHISKSQMSQRRPLPLHFELPDAACPNDAGSSDDDRKLALGFKRVAIHAAGARMRGRRNGNGAGTLYDAKNIPQAACQILGQFETLGPSPELAALQAKFHVAPRGMFVEASMPLIELVRSIDAHFAGLGDETRLLCRPAQENPDLYEIVDRQTQLTYLARRIAGDVDMGKLIARESQWLRIQRERLLYELSIGEKIFVYNQSSGENEADESEMLALSIALRQLGPNKLLFIARENASHTAGTVEQIFPGLYQGFSGAIATEDSGRMQSSWLEICANALSLAS